MLLSASSFAAQNRCVLTFLWAPPRDPGNATPQYIARGSQLVARHIRTQTRRSLNECALVRLASQAVPSPLKRAFKHCGAAIGSLIIKISRIANFYFAKVCSNKI